jgi:hypothetical protein
MRFTAELRERRLRVRRRKRRLRWQLHQRFERPRELRCLRQGVRPGPRLLEWRLRDEL